MSTIQQLDKLIAERKGKGPRVNPQIKAINERTVRVLRDTENFNSKEGEFRYEDGKPVKVGVPYHIHYTSDMSEVYMTEHEHVAEISRIIYPNGIKTDFQYYNTLNKQESLKIEGQQSIPNDKAYQRGFYFRYFARQANDDGSPPFEIHVSDYEKSSLYVYARVKFYISGDENNVAVKNRAQLLSASTKVPGLSKAVYPLQHYRYDRNLSPNDTIKERLGIYESTAVVSTRTTTDITQESGTTSDASSTSTGGSGAY